MMYDELIKSFNNEKMGLNQKQPNNPDFMVTDCPKFETKGLDFFFNQETPYKYPQLIISNDSKRINQSFDIYSQYMDVITDSCGNRYNIRNLQSAGPGLQAGYSVNIDLDSHLKNINYYADKCYYDNWKIAPNSELPSCNGLKHNSEILIPDYTAIGRHYEDCIGVCSNSSGCWNTAPTDLGCETNIRKRYDFSHNKFQTESCIKPNEWKYFQKTSPPSANELSKYPNGSRNQAMINSLNQGVQHDYYQFFQDQPWQKQNNWTENKCVSYPPQRLFNNVTKRSMLPSQHFRKIEPVYKS